MKRSKQVKLVLLGSVTTSVLVGCDPTPTPSYSSAGGDYGTNSAYGGSYTNNHYIAGRGYYHAPYHWWYPHPYNYYLADRGYFHGGFWTPQPNVSSIARSLPKSDSVRSSSSSSSSTMRSPSSSGSSKSSTTSGGTSRGGFGGSSSSSGS